MIAQAEETVTQMAVLVAPANGVGVLRDVFRSLQGNFPGVIVILLQKGTGEERSVADNLNVAPNFFILPGLDGTPLRNGRGYVVRAEAGLEIGADSHLTTALRTASELPRDETLLASVAAQYGVGAIAVALTALSSQEADGFRKVRASGGNTIALDESDRLWADSSGERVVRDAADELLSTADIGPRMLALIADV